MTYGLGYQNDLPTHAYLNRNCCSNTLVDQLNINCWKDNTLVFSQCTISLTKLDNMTLFKFTKFWSFLFSFLFQQNCIGKFFWLTSSVRFKLGSLNLKTSTLTTRPKSLICQRDQIEQFFEVPGNNFPHKSSPNIWWLFGLFLKRSHLSFNCCGYFWTFWATLDILSYFLFQHLVTLALKFSYILILPNVTRWRTRDEQSTRLNFKSF